MKLFMPKQHGAWAMLVVPFGLGIVAGGFSYLQIPLAFGWIALYLSTYHLLLVAKKRKVKFHLSWFYKYFVTAMIFIIPVIWMEPELIIVGLMMAPFFLLNIYFSSKKKDRLFWNDISAIFAFSFSGIATFYLGSGQIRIEAWIVWLLSVLFFVGSTFYVKSMIREKKNRHFHYWTWGFHVFVLFLFFLLGQWLIFFAFVPSLGRVLYCIGKNMRPMQMGIIEIVNSVVFFIFVSITFL